MKKKAASSIRDKCFLDFTTESGGQYILDGSTGAVIATNEIMQKAIDLYSAKSMKEVVAELGKTYSINEIKGVMSFLQRWSSQYGGLYRSDTQKNEVSTKMEKATEKDYKEIVLSGNISQLILTVTENCNLRCKYCYLSDPYEYTRNRTVKTMTLDVGIKALDMYFDYIRPVATKIPGKIQVVTFFGGEPLLNFNLLQRLIEYARANCPTPLIINLTTNGYFLTGEIADYLVDKDVMISVSFDGTKKDHDRNRVTANGEGSFDVVYGNIKRFQNKFPDYVKSGKLMLLPVYDYLTDLEASLNFFEENEMPTVAFVNPVSKTNTNYYRRFTDEDQRKHGEQMARLLELYKNYRKKGIKLPPFLNLIFLSLGLIRLRMKGADSRPFVIPYTSSCIPGHRIHVRVDGTLDMCERINQMFPIGHIDTGLDFAAVKRIIDLYNSGVTKECSGCALTKVCYLCPALCNHDCRFCSSVSCDDIHDYFKKTYSQYYSICEINPSAFNDQDMSLFNQIPLYH